MSEQTQRLAKLNWILLHLGVELLDAETDQRLLLHLREIYKTRPIAEMWECFQNRLIAWYDAYDRAFNLSPVV